MSEYIDTNIFLNPILYDDEKAKKCQEILSKIIKGQIIASTSFLTWDELVYVIKKNLGREYSVAEGKKFLQFPNLVFIKVDDGVMFKAQEMIEKYNLKPRDAIHAASALVKGIKKIISDDPDFDRVKELKRVGI